MVQLSARGSLILLLGQIISTLVAALGSIIVARLLGSTSYGQVAVAMIPASIAALFRDLGITSALIKYIAQYRIEKKTGEINVIMRTGLLLDASVGALLSLITFFLSGLLATDVFHQPELKKLIEVSSATLFAHSLLTTSQSVFVGFERMEFHSLTVIIQSILKSLLAPLLVLLGYGAFGAVLGSTVPIVVTGVIGITIVAIVFLKDGEPSGRAPTRLQACKILLSYGYPLLLSNLSTGALSQFYNVLMAVYVDAYMIGNYRAATNFYVLIAFLTMPVATVLFPLFSKLDFRENSLLRIVFQNSVKYTALITVPVTTALMVLSGPAVRIIYGSNYQFAPLFLKLFIVNSLFVGLGNISVRNLLNGQGKTKVTFVMNLLNLCMGVPLSLTLIPRFGIIGLLLAMIVAPKPGLFFALWWIKKNFGFMINWVASAKIYLSAGAAYLMASYLLATFSFGDWCDLLLGGGLLVMIYSLLIPLTGAMERSDIQNLRNIMGALGPLSPLFNMFLAIFERFIR